MSNLFESRISEFDILVDLTGIECGGSLRDKLHGSGHFGNGETFRQSFSS